MAELATPVMLLNQEDVSDMANTKALVLLDDVIALGKVMDDIAELAISAMLANQFSVWTVVLIEDDLPGWTKWVLDDWKIEVVCVWYVVMVLVLVAIPDVSLVVRLVNMVGDVAIADGLIVNIGGFEIRVEPEVKVSWAECAA